MCVDVTGKLSSLILILIPTTRHANSDFLLFIRIHLVSKFVWLRGTLPYVPFIVTATFANSLQTFEWEFLPLPKPTTTITTVETTAPMLPLTTPSCEIESDTSTPPYSSGEVGTSPYTDAETTATDVEMGGSGSDNSQQPPVSDTTEGKTLGFDTDVVNWATSDSGSAADTVSVITTDADAAIGSGTYYPTDSNDSTETPRMEESTTDIDDGVSHTEATTEAESGADMGLGSTPQSNTDHTDTDRDDGATSVTDSNAIEEETTSDISDGGVSTDSHITTASPTYTSMSSTVHGGSDNIGTTATVYNSSTSHSIRTTISTTTTTRGPVLKPSTPHHDDDDDDDDDSNQNHGGDKKTTSIATVVNANLLIYAFVLYLLATAH